MERGKYKIKVLITMSYDVPTLLKKRRRRKKKDGGKVEEERRREMRKWRRGKEGKEIKKNLSWQDIQDALMAKLSYKTLCIR
jgi:hypothetical protein